MYVWNKEWTKKKSFKKKGNIENEMTDEWVFIYKYKLALEKHSKKPKTLEQAVK